jgi:hypothetical protein
MTHPPLICLHLSSGSCGVQLGGGVACDAALVEALNCDATMEEVGMGDAVVEVMVEDMGEAVVEDRVEDIDIGMGDAVVEDIGKDIGINDAVVKDIGMTCAVVEDIGLVNEALKLVREMTAYDGPELQHLTREHIHVGHGTLTLATLWKESMTVA